MAGWGWITWSLIILALIGAVGFAAYRFALSNNAVALLDGADRLLRNGDGEIRQVAAVRYGTDAAQKLEMFVPAGASALAPLPVIVFIHGGGWHPGGGR